MFYFVYLNLVMKYTLGKKLVDILWEQMLLKTLLMPKIDFRIKIVLHQIIESIFYLTFKRKSFPFLVSHNKPKIFQFRIFLGGGNKLVFWTNKGLYRLYWVDQKFHLGCNLMANSIYYLYRYICISENKLIYLSFFTLTHTCMHMQTMTEVCL